jgi:hypothetical protein
MTDKKSKERTDEDAVSEVLDLDYRRSEIPDHVREIVATHLAIEAEDAKRAGTLGFMARALAIASMPHRNPKADIYERQNGDFKLRMLAGSSAGLPYGTLPRLLVSWVCTEAVITRSSELVLGDSLADFLRELQLTRTGGERGNITRLRDQMRRLFGTFISAEVDPSKTHESKRGGAALTTVRSQRIKLRNIQMIEEADVWWEPGDPEHAGRWQGTVQLTDSFYKDCIDAPVSVDLRVYKNLRSSPLAIDLYTWLTYRMSYLERPSGLIRWEALMNQFGSNYAQTKQGIRDFKRAFLRELKRVMLLYHEARVKVLTDGIILLPSPPHVKKLPKGGQGVLF